MKKKQAKKLLKAKKKMNKLLSQPLSENEILDTLSYFIKTYDSCKNVYNNKGK